ncbi:MAG: hypothetical protein QM683_09745 [Lacrimispora sp.]
MRLKRNRLKQYHHRSAVQKKDNEGNSYTEYGLSQPITAEVWPAGGKLQAEMYGQRLSYIRNCRLDGEYKAQTDEKGHISYLFDTLAIREGDGICLDVPVESDPDYKIIAIRPYRHLYMELEKI